MRKTDEDAQLASTKKHIFILNFTFLSNRSILVERVHVMDDR